MKINHKEVGHVAFGQLTAGEVFEFDGTAYMKIKTAKQPPLAEPALAWVRAACLVDGDLCYFHDDTLVRHLPNASLTLE